MRLTANFEECRWLSLASASPQSQPWADFASAPPATAAATASAACLSSICVGTSIASTSLAAHRPDSGLYTCCGAAFTTLPRTEWRLLRCCTRAWLRKRVHMAATKANPATQPPWHFLLIRSRGAALRCAALHCTALHPIDDRD
jgi:hypothetical protein